MLNRWTGGLLRTLGVLVLSAVVASRKRRRGPATCVPGWHVPLGRRPHKLAGTTEGALSSNLMLQSGGSDFGWAGLGFVSASVGFVVRPTHYSPTHFYRTRDGGRAWQVVPVF